VLVGHSYGGAVITGVVDRVPDRIRHVVYLDAAVLNDGESFNTAFGRGVAGNVVDGFVPVPGRVRRMRRCRTSCPIRRRRSPNR